MSDQPQETGPTWEQLAALGITEALDGGVARIDGVDHDADIEDEDGDMLPPGELYLSHDGGTIHVRVTVEVVEGAPS